MEVRAGNGYRVKIEKAEFPRRPCVVCGKRFRVGQMVAYIPACGSSYHLGCFEKSTWGKDAKVAEAIKKAKNYSATGRVLSVRKEGKEMEISDYKAHQKGCMTEREKREYELALRIGEAQFGTKCEHREVKAGYCLRCLRKVR